MYINIGKNAFLYEDDIVGVFDLDSSSQSYLTREFLSRAEKNGLVLNAAEDIPNSFLITDEEEAKKIYLSQSTSRTLAKRLEQMQKERSNTWRKTTN